MSKTNFKNKKIGIWGFGIVGRSAFNYFKKHTKNIQIIDQKACDHPAYIPQTTKNLQQFLEHNDYIVVSPGIPLHNYQLYKNKFIPELDIYQQEFKGQTIAITGTLGKTSITNLLATYLPNAIAGGNIGNGMLNIISEKKHPSPVILELSSFQLHYAKNFKPQISIWTNFYPNHLDHHNNEQEYFLAKCNILKYQNTQQITLLPCNLFDRIQTNIKIKAKTYLFCSPDCSIKHTFKTFKIVGNNITVQQDKTSQIIFHNIDNLPQLTFTQNWLIIIAAIYLLNINPQQLLQQPLKFQSQEHRLENLGTVNTTTFYNDSKSTVWQATKQALESIGSSQPCILFLGGLSKGSDRTPLIQYLQDKPVKVIAFGKEAAEIQALCLKYQVNCSNHLTLEDAFESIYLTNLPQNVLFSPAGSSFDLFKNYAQRGEVFKKLVRNIKS